MDAGQLSAASIQALGARFMTALATSAPQWATQELAAIETSLQQLSHQLCGQVLEAVVTARAAVPTRPCCPTCQRPLRRVDAARPRHLQSLVGECTLRRPYYVCASCHQGLAPLDAALGLGPGALTPGLSRVASRLGIALPFREAAAVLADTLQLAVAPEAVRRVTEGIGQVAEAAAQAAITQAQAGQPPLVARAPRGTSTCLLVAVDGTMVHRDGAWHEVKVGVVAPLGPGTRIDVETGRVCQTLGAARSCAGTEPAEAFWYRVYVEACRLGLGTGRIQTVVVLGDGADWIWRYAARFLGLPGVSVVEIVDYYHAVAHLWTVAQAVFGTAHPAAAWVESLQRELLTHGAAGVLAALDQLTPADAAAREVVEQVRGYVTTHAERVAYAAFLARQYPIGSGVVEGACKALVGARAKGAGMRWHGEELQAVLTLRALHQSGEWGRFWQTQPQRRRPAVSTCPPRAAPAPVQRLAA